MNTLQLVQAFKKDRYTRKSFCGVIPIDYLPRKKVKKTCAFIINTETSREDGQHWFAIYVPKNGPIEYFDSYGLEPKNKEVYDFINMNGKKFIHNKIKIQGDSSISCGKFSILFLYFRTRGYKMKDYLKFFTSNKISNDLLIRNLYNKVVK